MPTENQKAAVKETLELLGKGKRVSMGKVLKKNGYSAAMAKNPKQVTSSKGWNELLEEMLPDSLLSSVHQKVLKKKEKIVIGVGKGYTEIVDTGQPHTDALKAAELGYKLKGRLTTKTDITSDGKPIVLIDVATAQKYGIAPSTTPNSDGQPPL